MRFRAKKKILEFRRNIVLRNFHYKYLFKAHYFPVHSGCIISRSSHGCGKCQRDCVSLNNYCWTDGGALPKTQVRLRGFEGTGEMGAESFGLICRAKSKSF